MSGILVCGTRVDGDSYELFEELKEHFPIYTIIHGGAKKGGDAMASEFCHQYNIAEKVYRPNWRPNGGEYDPSAGFIRNRKMIDEENPYLVIARWDGRSNGTRHTIEYATQRGIPVRIIPVEEAD